MREQVIAGRYRLEERLAAGGMSEVWSATDLELERTIAVKLLAPEADPTRFEREARAAAALAHPNICALYDYGEAGGRPFMALEYLPGGSLEDRLAEGRPLPDEDTRRIAADIAAGLAHAHARGLVHRDLKPANVLFDADGRAKIADFGIARIGEGSGLTEAGTVLGTAAYISPEQAAGEPATAASDVYAFGVILFRMLTGRLPFESPDGLALVALHRDEPPPPVAAFRPDAPARLESLAAAALAKSPADRPRDGAALLAELGAPGRADRETAATQVLRPARRRSRTAGVVGVAALLAAAGVALAIVVTFRGHATTTPPSTSLPTTRATEESTAVSQPPTKTASETVATTAETTTEATTTEPTTTAPLTTAPVITLPPPPPPTTAAPPPPPTTNTTPTDTTTATTTAETTTMAAATAPVPPG